MRRFGGSLRGCGVLTLLRGRCSHWRRLRPDEPDEYGRADPGRTCLSRRRCPAEVGSLPMARLHVLLAPGTKAARLLPATPCRHAIVHMSHALTTLAPASFSPGHLRGIKGMRDLYIGDPSAAHDRFARSAVALTKPGEQVQRSSRPTRRWSGSGLVNPARRRSCCTSVWLPPCVRVAGCWRCGYDGRARSCGRGGRGLGDA